MKITTNANELAKQFDVAGRRVEREVKKAVRRTALDLQARIRKNASTGYHASKATIKKRKHVAVFRGHIPGTGPGPNVRTGNYRRSVQVTHGTQPSGTAESIVHTNAPQAKRLEYGFRGTDSRGRTYKQPPYPHWNHAMKIVEPTFKREVENAIRKALDNGSR